MTAPGGADDRADQRGADERGGRARRGHPAKREAVLRASRKVFGRVGYLSASIDAIATEAGVSTRTIYNHFANKEQLFATVLTDSSERVAAAHEAVVERHIGSAAEVADLEAALVAMARELAGGWPEFADHFAMVRRMHAEGDRFPRHLRDAWRHAGPLRVERALAACLAGLADRGLLHVADPECAARHLFALTSDTWGVEGPGLAEPPGDELDRTVTAGVRAFLYGYLPRP
ncbi:hypothetical protein GCM10027168_16230 [Streptomyces capparidis]